MMSSPRTGGVPPATLLIAIVAAASCARIAAGGTGGTDDSDAGSPAAVANAVPIALLVSGRIRPAGVELDPLLTVPASGNPPAPGTHRLTGLDADGHQLFDIPFESVSVAARTPDEEAHFSFSVTLTSAAADRLQEVVVRLADGRRASRRAAHDAAAIRRAAHAPGAFRAEPAPAGAVRLRWDAQRFPLVLVRDAASGAVLSFGRDGNLLLPAPPAVLDVFASDGVRTARITIPTP